MKNKVSIKKNYIYNLINSLLTVIIPLITAPYLSRVLGVDGIGIRSYTLSIVSNFILIASMGIASYAQREISMNRDDKYKYSKITYEIGILRVITTIIVTVLYVIAFVLPIFNRENNVIYAILMLNIIANMLDFSWFFQGMEDFKKISLVQSITKVLSVIFTLTLVKKQSDIAVSVLINSMVLILNSIIPFFALKKYCCKVNIKDIKLKKHFKECMIYFVPAIAVQVYTVMDKTMIGMFSTTTENGYYEQADKIVKISMSVVTSINIIMRSRMSYLFKNEDINGAKELIGKSLNLFCLSAYPITFGIISISKQLVPIFFGPEFDKTATIINILSPLVIIIGISNLIGTHYLTPKGKQKTSNKCLITGACVNLILNLILIRKLGSIGAAIASIIAESVITILYLKNAKEIINIIEIIKKSKNYLIASVIMFIFIYVCKIFIKDNIIGLFIQIIIGIVVYGISLLVMKDKFIYEIKNQFFNKVKSYGKYN